VSDFFWAPKWLFNLEHYDGQGNLRGTKIRQPPVFLEAGCQHLRRLLWLRCLKKSRAGRICRHGSDILKPWLFLQHPVCTLNLYVPKTNTPKTYPGKKPQTARGSGRIMYDHVVDNGDDDDGDDDDDDVMM